MQRGKFQKLNFFKMLLLDASYCKATNTGCIDLMEIYLRGSWWSKSSNL